MPIIKFLKKGYYFFYESLMVIELSYLTMPGTITLQYSECTSDFFFSLGFLVAPWLSFSKFILVVFFF